MSHFEISSKLRRQLFEAGSPTTDLYKRIKLGPVYEVADVLERDWWPSIQPYTSVDLRSDQARLMHVDAAELKVRTEIRDIEENDSHEHDVTIT